MFQNDLFTNLCKHPDLLRNFQPSIQVNILAIKCILLANCNTIVKASCYIQFLGSATKIVFNILINIADTFHRFNTANISTL